MNKALKILSLLLFGSLIAASWSTDITDGCDLPDSPTTSYLHLTADGSVLYKSLQDIGGFQFFIDGDDVNINDASGGAAAAAGFIMSTINDPVPTVLGFSLSGTTIPAGCGTLVILDLSGDATGLSEIIVSNAAGS